MRKSPNVVYVGDVVPVAFQSTTGRVTAVEPHGVRVKTPCWTATLRLPYPSAR